MAEKENKDPEGAQDFKAPTGEAGSGSREPLTWEEEEELDQMVQGALTPEQQARGLKNLTYKELQDNPNYRELFNNPRFKDLMSRRGVPGD